MTKWLHQYVASNKGNDYSRCHRYLDQVVQGACRPDVVRHTPFYSLCQAVFYLFVFRHKGLLEMEGGVVRERERVRETIIYVQ